MFIHFDKHKVWQSVKCLSAFYHRISPVIHPERRIMGRKINDYEFDNFGFTFLRGKDRHDDDDDDKSDKYKKGRQRGRRKNLATSLEQANILLHVKIK